MRVRAIKPGEYAKALVAPGNVFTIDPADFDETWMAALSARPPVAKAVDPLPPVEDLDTARERLRADHLRIQRRIAAGLDP